MSLESKYVALSSSSMDSSRAQICWALVSFVGGVVLVGVGFGGDLELLFSVVVSHMFILEFRFTFFGQSRAM